MVNPMSLFVAKNNAAPAPLDHGFGAVVPLTAAASRRFDLRALAATVARNTVPPLIVVALLLIVW